MTIEEFTKQFREESERQLQECVNNATVIEGFSIVTIVKTSKGVAGIRHIAGDLSIADVAMMNEARSDAGSKMLSELYEKHIVNS